MPFFRQIDELEGIPVINIHLWFDKKLNSIDGQCECNVLLLINRDNQWLGLGRYVSNVLFILAGPQPLRLSLRLSLTHTSSLTRPAGLCFSRSPLLSVYADMSTSCRKYMKLSTDQSIATDHSISTDNSISTDHSISTDSNACSVRPAPQP